MDRWEILISVCTVVAVFVFLLSVCVLLVWAERRLGARMQLRIGPNRAGPFGLLQTVADAVKLLMKETFVPSRADRSVYDIAPFISIFTAFLALSIVPFGPGFEINGYRVNMQVADLNVGILWFLSMSSIAVYGVMLAGWSSGSKYPLLGSVRASAQVISYEAAMSLAIVPVIVWAGTLDTQGIVEAQAVYNWFAIPLVVPFVLFFVAGVAETNRGPFDLVEAESEIVAGFHTEYGGSRFMLFYLAEYVNMITISALTATLFLGGWNGPTPGLLPDALWGFIWFFAKTCLFLFVFIWIRMTLPRLRYDQLMSLGWKVLIPVNLVYLAVVAVVVTLQESGAVPDFFVAGR
jgi:NADH-quinone oxidoreductase subunit H